MDEFIPYDAVKYRSLDADSFEERRNQIIDLLTADELPEGVDEENLYAERDLIIAEATRRNSATELRNAKLAALTSGAGNLIATSAPATEAKAEEPQKRSRIHTIRDVTPYAYTDSYEYRSALAKHILRHAPMPSDMIAKARQERNAAVNINGDYNAVADFSNTFSTNVAIPNSLNEEIIREEREYGNIGNKVNEVHVQGGLTYTEADLQITYSWIGDTEVSDYQEQPDGTTFSFVWHQLEARFARTMLADALLRDNFKALLAPALAEGFMNAKENAILRGNGTTQPLGILVDPRLKGQGTSGQDGYIEGHAQIIEVTKEQMDDWKFWRTVLYGGFNRLYRGRGEWIFGDSTWGMHIDLLRDDENRPLYKSDPLNDDEPLRLRNRPVNLVEDTLLPSFDDAQVGDIFGIFGDLKKYTINTQPGMPMSVVSWDDHENNARKTKVLTALDGRVVNPYGWALLKKKASA